MAWQPNGEGNRCMAPLILPDAMRAGLKEVEVHEMRSFRNLVRQALREYVAAFEKEHGKCPPYQQ